MGTKERRERERVDTRRRILDAAREMFVQRGYEATTMRAIADHIEYTPTAIYHHFRSKEALLTELCTHDFRALAQAFQRIGQVADPLERLRRIGQAYIEFGIMHPMHYQLMFMTRHPDVSGASEIRQGDPGEDAYAFLLHACQEAIAAGRFRRELQDPHEVAQILWAGCHGLVALHISKEHDEWVEWREVGSTATRLHEVMLHGLLQPVNG
ncbi:MAG: TetR/AcrR family transcriptional regulator [Gemmatimonadales bacterium]